MKRYVVSALIGLSLFAIPALVLAQNMGGGVDTNTGGGTQVNSGASSGTVTNPLGSINSFCGVIKAVLGAAIQIGIPIAVLFIVYAGFKFVLAQGKPEDLKAARTNFMWTLIGIGIFLGAWLLTQVVANTINAVGGSGASSFISCQ